MHENIRKVTVSWASLPSLASSWFEHGSAVSYVLAMIRGASESQEALSGNQTCPVDTSG